MKVSKAFRAGVPLVAVTTGDPAATIRTISEQFAGFDDPVGVIVWDVVRGAKCSKADQRAVDALANLPNPPDDYAGSLVNFLADLCELARRQVVIICNAHLFLDDPRAVQAIWNLRDEFKASKKLLVLLGVAKLPPELIHDVVQFDDPLPSVDELSNIIQNVCEWGKAQATEAVLAEGATAAIGVTAFCAENLACLAMDKNGLEVDGVY